MIPVKKCLHNDTYHPFQKAIFGKIGSIKSTANKSSPNNKITQQNAPQKQKQNQSHK